MKLYRVNYFDQSTGSHGFGWYTSRAQAERIASKYVRDNAPEPETGDAYVDLYRNRTGVDRPEVEEVEFELTKRSVLALLQAYAAHADNG